MLPNHQSSLISPNVQLIATAKCCKKKGEGEGEGDETNKNPGPTSKAFIKRIATFKVLPREKKSKT